MKLLLFALLMPLCCFCQNTIGLPEIINYSKLTYNGGLQTWDIQQDKNGIIYCANNEGLLTFDGKGWSLFPLPNKTIVRSVAIGEDGKIYVGGQDEIGFFTPSAKGILQFISLKEKLPAKEHIFGDVWDIVAYKKTVFFRTNSYIFKLTGDYFESFKAHKEWAFMGICHQNMYAQDSETGLTIFKNGAWQPIEQGQNIPSQSPVTAMLAAGNDSIIVATLKTGLFLLYQNQLKALPCASDVLFKSHRIYAATKIDDAHFAWATNKNGVYITNAQGVVVQQFAQAEGLQHNNVLCIFLDKQKNLWLGLDNGIDCIAYNSAIKHIIPELQSSSGYAAAIHQQHLYIGTSSGLYKVPLENHLKNLSFSKGQFSLVENTDGQVWGLASINNQLLMGHHEGAFALKNDKMQPLNIGMGYWNFLPISKSFPSPGCISGNYKGIALFNYDGNSFKETTRIPGFEESSRYFAQDENGHIWVSHPYHGIYQLSPIGNHRFQIQAYHTGHGLPSLLNNHIYFIKNQIVAATEKGVYVYQANKNKFEPFAQYQSILGNQSIRYLKEDVLGNIWFIHEKQLGVIDFSNKTPQIFYLPELNNKLLSGFEFIYPADENNIFIGGEKGFFHVDFEAYKRNISTLNVQIRGVKIIHQSDSLIFGGYFNNVNDAQKQQSNQIPSIPNIWKTIHFEYATPLFGFTTNLLYSYRLKGFDDHWSEWTNKTEKEYTNLPPGKYIFEVRCKTNLGTASEAATYSFILLPPWYLSLWAKFFYAIAIFSLFYGAYNWQQQRFEKKQQAIKNEQKNQLYIRELELSKRESELVTLRNAKLESDINFKNSELASSAMHLVKKGELLSKIKNELNHIIKKLEHPQAISELKKMIRALSEDDHMDDEWEQFTVHFDKVHSDFLVALKEKHPTITPNELKLSAYLRMNLSTKEIAQLMNISVRGVEISRYRLRKKLDLPTEVSLFDYLIGIQSKKA